MAKPKKKTKKPLNRNQHVKRKLFLEAFVKCGTVAGAAEIAGVERTTHYLWMADPEYAKRFDDATEQAADMLEQEAHRRSRDGLLRMKFHQGQPIIDPRTLPSGDLFDPRYPLGKPYFEHEYSDTLLIFLLKGLRPEKFRENLDITTKGRALPAPTTDFSNLTDDELIKFEQAFARGAGRISGPRKG